MTFLDRVDMLLARRGLNKNQLAALTGIPVSTVYGWYKKGYGSITLPTMLKLSEFFGCSMEYLVNGATAVEKTPSPAAMDVARHYDSLPEHTQKLISALVLFESADLDVKNNIIAHLVDHANDKLAKESAFNAASDQIMEALTSGPLNED